MLFHQGGAIANQLMATTRAGMVDGARNGIDLAPLLGGQARGDQRATGGTGLDHQHTQ